ncbi:DUF4843 domain-containing protein [Marinifilum sp.]|uniref:DUF4843 domain-containing protein n=1 Tax=Marinifilum sp. TaxID=2033137 RepID=UPI003BABD05C
MKIKNILFLILFILGAISCTENDIMTYGEQDYIYIQGWETRESGEVLQTSFTFLFEDESVNEKTLEIPVMALGNMTSTDRLFSIKVVDSLTTAVEGTHFSIDASSQVIPANSTEGSISVNLIKTADMKDTDYQLGLELISSDNFTPGVSTVVKITYNDYFAEPDWWLYELYNGYPTIGPFTQKKAILWLQYRGVTDGSDPLIEYKSDSYNDYIGGYNYNPSEIVWAHIYGFKNWLETDSGGLYYDENGDLISETFNY